MTPDDPRNARNEHLAARLRIPVVAALATSLVAAVTGGRAQTVASTAVIVVLIGTPLARLAWMGNRWRRRGDRSFAWAAVGLASVISLGALAAALV